jgi:hypothetical protein
MNPQGVMGEANIPENIQYPPIKGIHIRHKMAKER